MNNDKGVSIEQELMFLYYVLLFLVAFILGIAVGKGSIGRFYRYCYSNDQTIYIGDKVRFRKHSKYGDLYNTCESITVIGLQAVSQDNEAWILTENCSGFMSQDRYIGTDVVSQSILIKQK